VNHDPTACIDCLRRAHLVELLAPYIEKLDTGAPGRRSSELLRLSNAELAQLAAPRVASQILAQVKATSEARLRENLTVAECWAVCCHDWQYPVGLRDDAADAPEVLIGRGDPRLLSRLSPARTVSVVGARRASSYGRETARELGRDLASAGVVVVSGLAFGIDACAHRGALEGENAPTVAVLGCGPDIAYPAAHRSLWRRISESGLVLSELLPGVGAWRWTFPARSRIMAALAGMTVVVEAAERSGSLITAEIAADLGREIGAVPGPAGSRLSAAPNSLIAGGARLIQGAQDAVLDATLFTTAKPAEIETSFVEAEMKGLRQACGYDEDDETDNTSALIDYKNALEERLREEMG